MAKVGSPDVGEAVIQRMTDHTTTDPAPGEPLAALLPDLQSHPELDLETLVYHLRQSDATATDGYCHASINEARSFLEALVVSIVHAVRRTKTDSKESRLRDPSQNGTSFRAHRRSLLESGFIDADENDLLQYMYSVASAKGGHHGITDYVWAQLARRIVDATARYLLCRYASWKQEGRTIATPHARRARDRDWVRRILRHFKIARSEDPPSVPP
ncbi:MAG: hypothetical protein MI923_10080 [Phycisphaerales bacterium]|nr:hypothetical protein [Phycisphaerales bacterium]